MMISPETFVNNLKDSSYLDLVQHRENLIMAIHKFEKNEMKGDRSDPSWHVCPSPEVRYQMNLEYLAALCSYMKDKYNQEYVWGGRTLKQDDRNLL